MRLTQTLLLAFFFVLGCAKKNSPNQGPQPIPPDTSFAKGADVGWITEMESAGRKFHNSAGAERDGIALLKELGLNTIRLRVWVNPTEGWNGKADVVAKALRAKAAGMRLMIDFHYSDSWADPGKQTKPASWNTADFASLKDSLANHTKDVLQALKSAGVTPEWVQVGNETNDGMLWPTGKASTNMSAFVQLFNAGYDAVKEVFPSSKVILHISNGYNNSLFRWMLDGFKNNNGKYDVIGMSLYPAPNSWTTMNAQALNNMNDLIVRYNKEIMVVEIGMPWDSATETRDFIKELVFNVRTLPSKKGLGVLYWEPLSYNGWKGYTLGAFDNTGKPTIALTGFQ